MHLTLTLNGKPVSADIDAATLLVDFIRTHQALTGTHVGCDTAQCGACTVLVDGKATKSCNVLALQVAGSSITTIEGLAADDGTLHPMQSAFKQHHGLQCGFCTPGMVLSAVELKGKNLSEEQIRAALDGNMCRCTGYQNIVKAVKTGLANMA